MDEIPLCYKDQMHEVIYRDQIFQGACIVPVSQGFPGDRSTLLVPVCLLPVERQVQACLFIHDCGNHTWGSHAVGQERCRSFSFNDRCVHFFLTGRAYKLLLVVPDTLHPGRRYAQFFTDILITQVIHLCTTVRTLPFSRGDIAVNLFYGKRFIYIFPHRLWFSCPCMLFYCHLNFLANLDLFIILVPVSGVLL